MAWQEFRGGAATTITAPLLHLSISRSAASARPFGLQLGMACDNFHKL
jgi:hypothetical protein